MKCKTITSMMLMIAGMSLGFSKTASAASLCEKYGAALPKVVDDFVAKTAPNPKVDFFRKGKFSKVDVPKLKEHLINFMSDAIGCEGKKYKGRDMKATHKGMKITKKQFEAIAADLQATLTEDGVSPEDVKTIMGVVATTADDIIEKK